MTRQEKREATAQRITQDLVTDTLEQQRAEQTPEKAWNLAEKTGATYSTTEARPGATTTAWCYIPVTQRETVLKIPTAPPYLDTLGGERLPAAYLLFWPGISTEVAEYCQTCMECQRTARVKNKALLIPLPVIEEPSFSSLFVSS